MKRSFFVFFAFLIVMSLESYGQLADAKILTLADAQRISDAAEKRARQDNWNVVIAVVDAGGHLITLKRMDGTQVGSVEVAMKKATSAVYFRRPTKAFQDAVAAGNLGVTQLPNAMPVEGGLPIVHNGKVVGAIGISGVTSEQDGIIAKAGTDAL